MKPIKVVCGIIYKDNKIFICRKRKGKPLEGYWEFPGGKIEADEKHEDALERELKEELEMEVQTEKLLKSTIYHYENFSIELIAYICQYKEWDGSLTDHDDFKWVDASELLEYPLAPADIPIAKALISKAT